MQNLCCQNVLKVKFLKIVAEYLLFTYKSGQYGRGAGWKESVLRRTDNPVHRVQIHGAFYFPIITNEEYGSHI